MLHKKTSGGTKTNRPQVSKVRSNVSSTEEKKKKKKIKNKDYRLGGIGQQLWSKISSPQDVRGSIEKRARFLANEEKK